MRLHYRVNQVESLRRGINAPNREVSLEVDPASLSETDRELLASYVFLSNDDKLCVCTKPYSNLLEANVPGVDALLVAIRDNEAKIAEKKRIETEKQAMYAKQEAERRASQLAADPTGDQWLTQDGYQTGRSGKRWRVYGGYSDDAEMNAVRAIAQAEADRRNAELDAAEDKEKAEKAIRDAVDRKNKRLGW